MRTAPTAELERRVYGLVWQLATRARQAWATTLEEDLAALPPGSAPAVNRVFLLCVFVVLVVEGPVEFFFPPLKTGADTCHLDDFSFITVAVVNPRAGGWLDEFFSGGLTLFFFP